MHNFTFVKQFNKTLLIAGIFVVCMLSAGTLLAQPTWTSQADGPWSSSSTWVTSGGASGAPSTNLTSNQRVIITNGHVVTNGNDILMEGTSRLTIQNGGKLIMGTSGSPAPTFTMKSSNNQFIMNNGVYQSRIPGSGGNMLIEAGVVDWRGSSLYVSGNYLFKKDAFVTMINVCQTTAQNILFEGINTSSNPAVLNNVYHIAGISGTGNFGFEESFINATDIRIIVGSQSGSASFKKTAMNGSIFSIYGNDGIEIQDMSGSTSLEYYCANSLSPNLNYFSGPKINNCAIAQGQVCGAGVSYCISGTVYDNPNYPPIQNGTGTGTAGATQLYISLVDASNNISSTSMVASNGTYSFCNLGPGNYSLVLHTTPGGSGTPQLPTGWENTAEGIDPNGDGTPDGVIYITGLLANITSADFGIKQDVQDPSIAIVKIGVFNDENGDTYAQVGETITYTFTVHNTGNVPLSNITVTDPLPGLSAITYVSGDTNNDGILDLTETWVYTATYTIDQDDIDAGQVVNQALATGVSPLGVTVQDLSGTAIDNDTPTVTDLPQNPVIAIIKAGVIDSGDCTQVGDVITYTFTVTNEGNVTLSNVVVTDPLAGLSAITFVSGDTNNDGNLDIGEVWVYTATYAVTQADIDAGEVVNQATVTAQDTNGDPVSDLSGTAINNDDPTVIGLCQDAKIAIVKEGVIDSGDCTQVGDIITYTFTVTNEGNVTLSNVVVTDPLAGLSAITFVSGDTNNDGNLDIGEVWVYTASYAVTQADIDAGEVENQATVVAEDTNGDPVSDLSGTAINNDDPTVIELCQDAQIAIVKEGTIDSGDCTAVGDVITYTFTVTNEGNVTLSNVDVTDPLDGLSAITFVGGDTNNDGNLDIGEVWTYTATYVVTQEDIDAGEVVNQATAAAEDTNGEPVSDLSGTAINNDDPTVIELCQDAQIALVKTGIFIGEGDCAEVGDEINYTFTVTNQGNVVLSDVVVTDPMFEEPNPIVSIDFVGGDDNGDGLLDLNEVWVYTANYVITQDDIDAGEVINQALVEALDPDGLMVSDLSGTAIDNDNPTIVDLCQQMSIALEKTGVFDDNNGDGSAQVGETVSYTFTVHNTGLVTLYNITIDDPLVPVQGGPIESLAPGESDSTTFTAVYVITQEDLDAGEVVNVATVFGEDINGNMIEAIDDEIVVLPQVAPACEFIRYNYVTPNNDGINDYFRISCIEDYPNNNVQIFNRWGVLVFETDGYRNETNDFRGVSEGRVTVKQGDLLPTGTYFYIIRFTGDENPGNSSYSGYLYLNR
jgi:gliding motility-associated-like protein/uncharacterized repeat protein (TIGR01451 family)